MINVTVDDAAILAALRQLQNHATNLRPALKEIGETLKESTKQRFGSKTGPDGEAWLGNSEDTIARKGRDWPLTDSGTLGDTIHFQLQGNDSVAIGSPMQYAAMMQFGGTKEEFPYLWGDIAARPFLGISRSDETEILSILRDYLESAI